MKIERSPVALVTGASRGIGRGIAVELARAGFSVVINYRGNREAAEETRRACIAAAPDSGAKFVGMQADISAAAERDAMLDRIYAELGEIDALVNNAGIAPRVRADVLEASEASFEELIHTNLQGPYFLTQKIARRWVAGNAEQPGADRRKIVFVTSISAMAASLNRGDYCVSKAGLAMAVQLFALRLAEHGIPVFEVRPGIVRTDMTNAVHDRYDKLISEGLVPQKRWGTPEDVGKAVRALLSNDFPFSTGSVVYSDGGLHIARL
ncbi:MAG TPA: 3-ketoacyl-ACP reductase [Spirochaetia bacterium]|nr:3-ketoacyl-ACP reductase [Spirochaetia bacterium]